MSQYPPPPTSDQTHYAFYNPGQTGSSAGQDSPSQLLDEPIKTDAMSYQSSIDAAAAADAYSRAESNLQALAHHNSQVAAAAVGADSEAPNQAHPPTSGRSHTQQSSGSSQSATVSQPSPQTPQHPHHHHHQQHPHHPHHQPRDGGGDHVTAATAAAAALSAVNSPHLNTPATTDYTQLAPLAHMGVSTPTNGDSHGHPHPHSHSHSHHNGIDLPNTPMSTSMPGSAGGPGGPGTSPSDSPVGASASELARARANRLKKACDSCSVRKVKCDESGPPCRACAILDIPCTFNRPSKRRGPPNKHAEAIKRRRREAEAEEAFMAAAAVGRIGPDSPMPNSAQSVASGMPFPSPAGVASAQPNGASPAPGQVGLSPYGVSLSSVDSVIAPSLQTMSVYIPTASMGNGNTTNGGNHTASTTGATVTSGLSSITPSPDVLRALSAVDVRLRKPAVPEEEKPRPVLRSHMA